MQQILPSTNEHYPNAPLTIVYRTCFQIVEHLACIYSVDGTLANATNVILYIDLVQKSRKGSRHCGFIGYVLENEYYKKKAYMYCNNGT